MVKLIEKFDDCYEGRTSMEKHSFGPLGFIHMDKKNTGGLRLHVIRALNDAYLIKLRWCLVAGSEELWARVLSFKYSKGGFYSTYKIKSLSLTYPMCGRAFSKTCTPRVTLKA